MDLPALLEAIDVGIVRQDASTRLTFANGFARRLLGLDDVSLTSSLDPAWDAIHADGTPCPGPSHPAPVALREKRTVRDAVLGVRTRDGRRVWLQVTATPELDGSGDAQGVVVVFTDITARVGERAASDDARQLSDANHRAVLRAMGEGVIVVGLDEQLMSFNPAAAQILGLAADATAVDCQAFDEAGRALSPAERPWSHALRGQSVRGTTLGVVLRDGHERWVRINADPIRFREGDTHGVVATVADVTDERAALDELRKERSRLRLMTDAVPAVLFEHVEHATGTRFSFMGPGIEQLIGVSAEAVLADAQRFWAAVHPEDLERVRRGRREAMEADGVFDEQLRLAAADGAWRWTRLRLSAPRHVDGGRVVHGLLLDITAQHGLDERLRDAQRQESLGLLAAGVAHNFNNILSTILPTLEHLQADASPSMKDALDDAWRAAQSAGELVRQLTQVVRKPARGEHETVDCGEVMDDVVALCRRTFGRRVTVTSEAPLQPVHVRARRGEFHQVLLALCLNARDAMEKVAAPALSLRLARAGAHAVLTVTDSGTGMTPEVMRRLGEPFFTTREPGRGTGLGLAASLGILREFGGELRWTSELGRGSTFTITMPATATVAPRPSPPVAPPRAPRPLSGRKVLLVDDEPMVRRSLRRVLERLGVEVHEAGDGPSGLEALAQRGDLDAVFVDLSMPEMRGDEVLRRIRQQWAQLPVFILSGFVDDPAALSAATGIINKPFTNEAVRDVLLATLPR